MEKKGEVLTKQMHVDLYSLFGYLVVQLQLKRVISIFIRIFRIYIM